MRWARTFIVFAVAGCGRIAFDPLGSAAQPDAANPPTFYAVSGDGNAPTELLEIDLVNARVQVIGTLPASLGILGGLAYWDANTLYASTTGGLYQITLSPLGAVMTRSLPGTVSSLERDGAMLFGIDQDGEALLRFAPEANTTPTSRPLGIDAYGGDLVEIDAIWYWYSNTTSELYTVTMTADPVRVGAPTPDIPFVSGLLRDDAGNLFYTTDTDELISVDKTTGQELARRNLGHDLRSGDATRTP